MRTQQKVHVNQDPFQSGVMGHEAGYFQGSGYPGIGLPGSGFQQGGNLPASFASSPQGSGLLSKLPLKDIQVFIDRMGGIDGILNAMGKAQKLMQSVQQVAPMLKLVMGSLIPAKSKSANVDLDDLEDYTRRRRRRRRRRRKSGSSKGRSISSTAKKAGRTRSTTITRQKL